MNKKHILIVSDSNRNNESFKFSKLVAQGFDTTLSDSDEKAIELANRQQFDLVVIDETSTEINGGKLMAVLPILQSEIEVLRYEGEPINELENKIKNCFAKKKAQRIMRFLILAESAPKAWKSLPSFSAN